MLPACSAAVGRGDLEAALAAMADGASLAQRDENQWSLAEIAAHRGHSAMVELLLQFRA